MKRLFLALLLLTLGLWLPAHAAVLLYDNTLNATPDTVFYSIGPYIALGDQIQLIAPGTATQAKVELFNNGGAGTFDAELDFFFVGSPVGSPIGSFTQTNISSTGQDVLDITFNLGAGLSVPQNLIWTVSISNTSPGMDLGVDMYEPPTVGSSDNTFMIGETSGGNFSQLDTDMENVFFQLSGTSISATPEPSTIALLPGGLVIVAIGFRSRRRLAR